MSKLLNFGALIQRIKAPSPFVLAQLSSIGTGTMEGGPIESAIRAGLTARLNPIHLEIVNESYMHNVPKGSESHFKVLVVSDQFEGLPLIKRHRLVNEIVKDKLEGDFVHALSIVAKTPGQWTEAEKLEPSPKCRGGFGK
ncbi:bolA-like protein DDB_G0274169 [Uranotaenia lowii]|uniref:bolA-like protein DDB_G0274169 n=1 Tax=Uranotaenia lowii TaxID=190385 RepID=UPI00247A6D7C|nr:bolA-like protein DDB_G0274169 [Uranotaenia lowii]